MVAESITVDTTEFNNKLDALYGELQQHKQEWKNLPIPEKIQLLKVTSALRHCDEEVQHVQGAGMQHI